MIYPPCYLTASEIADLRGLDDSIEMIPRTIYPARYLASLGGQIRAMIHSATQQADSEGTCSSWRTVSARWRRR